MHYNVIYRVICSLVLPLKVQLIKVRLGVSWPIYANVDSPNLGFLGGTSLKKHPVDPDRLAMALG